MFFSPLNNQLNLLNLFLPQKIQLRRSGPSHSLNLELLPLEVRVDIAFFTLELSQNEWYVINIS